MSHICKMQVQEFFKLSTGQIALVGEVTPNIEKFISKCDADLYIDGQKITSVHIVGEDIFSGVNKDIQKNKRSVRTNDNIIDQLRAKKGHDIELIILVMA